MGRRATLVAALVLALLGVTSAPALAAPVASVSATDLSFVDDPGGVASPTQDLTVTNTGDAVMKVTGDSVATPGAFNVTADGCKNQDVAPAANCVITLEFEATDENPLAGSLTIATNGPGDIKITLRGNAPRATVDATPQSLTAPVGTTSAAKQITLTNTGLKPLVNTTPIIVGPNFTVRSTTCGDPLQPAASCTSDVTFTPTAVSSGYTALLRFSTNDPVTPVVNIPLNGSGTAGTGPGPGTNPPPTPGAPDTDGDEVIDAADFCPIVPGNLKNGCPSELNAQIIGRWRTNTLFSKLISLSVRTTTGSRIELRCSNDRNKCGFKKRTITSTTRRVTSLTRFFKGSRVLSAGTSISVRVSRPQQVGTYKRLVTRRGRRLPKVSEGCLSARTGAVGPCA